MKALFRADNIIWYLKGCFNTFSVIKSYVGLRIKAGLPLWFKETFGGLYRCYTPVTWQGSQVQNL